MKFCAFLRGVNVKGTNMKMAEVKAVFEKIGMQNVNTVLASGNVVFESDQPASNLRKILEKAMSQHFNYEAFLFVKNQQEIENTLKSVPFESSENFHIYAFVCEKGNEKMFLEEFNQLNNPENGEAKIIDGTFYWKIGKGNTLNPSFGKILGRKAYKDVFTSRNINTFEKILKKF